MKKEVRGEAEEVSAGQRAVWRAIGRSARGCRSTRTTCRSAWSSWPMRRGESVIKLRTELERSRPHRGCG